MPLFRKTFDGAEFAGSRSAEAFLEAYGFSYGRSQRGDPRGILFGDWDIQKWRNLNTAERAALHGTMTGDNRDGPVTVEIFDTEHLPEAARTALRAYAQSLLSKSEAA